jgi:hypothetical protein
VVLKWTRALYDALESNREQIENDFGNALCWSRNGLRSKECKYSLMSYVVVKKRLQGQGTMDKHPRKND